MSHNNLATEALLNVAAPAISSEDYIPLPSDYSDSFPEIPPLNEPEPSHAKSSWLDAMPVDREYELHGEYLGISAVNSDDNGLYRMFIGAP